VQCVNVLIRCGPWWDPTWKKQAEGLVLRPGQTKTVRIFEVRAKHCMVEKYMGMVRDYKKSTRSTSM
jgi:SNF2 family DNA or RNA helicase